MDNSQALIQIPATKRESSVTSGLHAFKVGFDTQIQITDDDLTTRQQNILHNQFLHLQRTVNDFPHNSGELAAILPHSPDLDIEIQGIQFIIHVHAQQQVEALFQHPEEKHGRKGQELESE